MSQVEQTGESIWTVRGAAGPTLAIVGGIHGDERAGIEVIQQLRDTLKLVRGTVHLILGNPPAIEKGVRMLNDENLNRRFFADNQGSEAVDVRARELMAVLRTCDACIDLHEHKEETTSHFIACEPPSFPLARAINPSAITFDWLGAEPGATDSFMYEIGKVGICYEAGANTLTAGNVQLQLGAVDVFLRYYGVVAGEKPQEGNPRMVRINRSIIKQTNSFRFNQHFQSFQALQPGEVFATDGAMSYKAQVGEVIIFPRAQNPIGAEACIIGKFVSEGPDNGA
jgi:succinylglutamate desuccinylase